MRKSFIAGLIAVLMVAALAVPAASAYTPVVGLSLPTTQDPFFVGMGRGALASGADVGVNVQVMVGDGSVETERANVAAMLEQGVEAVLLSPADPTDLSAVALAKEAGVPVFLVGTDLALSVAQADVTSLILPDYRQGGTAAGMALCKAVGEEGTVIAVVSDATEAARAQRAGFDAYMAKTCPAVTVVPLEAGALDIDAAQTALIDLLGQQDVAGVFAYNGDMTTMAINASFLSGQRGVKVVGADATDDAMAALEQEVLSAVVTPVGWWMGEAGVLASNAYFQEETVPASILVNLGIMNMGVITTFRGGGGGDSGFSGGGGDDSGFSGGGGDDSGFSGGGGDDSGFSGGGGDDSGFSGGGGDDSGFSGGGGDDSGFSGGGGDDSGFSGGGGDDSGFSSGSFDDPRSGPFAGGDTSSAFRGGGGDDSGFSGGGGDDSGFSGGGGDDSGFSGGGGDDSGFSGGGGDDSGFSGGGGDDSGFSGGGGDDSGFSGGGGDDSGFSGGGGDDSGFSGDDGGSDGSY